MKFISTRNNWHQATGAERKKGLVVARGEEVIRPDSSQPNPQFKIF
jgi:hypothetical protein